MSDDDKIIKSVIAKAYKIPTQTSEADGTLVWNSTTLVTVEIRTLAHMGVGYTYASAAAAQFIDDTLKNHLIGKYVFDVSKLWWLLLKQSRNNHANGLVMMAISAIDIALWDLKSRLLNISIGKLLGSVHNDVCVYGSGGFTNYSDFQLREHLQYWKKLNLRSVKIKINSDISTSLRRVALARRILGNKVDLFVDANGAFETHSACVFSSKCEPFEVSWFEEPVSSDNIHGLKTIKNFYGRNSMKIVAGEYGDTIFSFRELLENRCVDVLQADITRCGGLTGIQNIVALCSAYQVPLSFHCAPSLHAQVACCFKPSLNVEYFFDHVRIENIFLNSCGVNLSNGKFHPSDDALGFGISFNAKKLASFQVYG